MEGVKWDRIKGRSYFSIDARYGIHGPPLRPEDFVLVGRLA